jgi:hypothetical protein
MSLLRGLQFTSPAAESVVSDELGFGRRLAEHRFIAKSLGLWVVSGPPGSSDEAACSRRVRRGARQNAKLREQLCEVVVVPILDDPPARIELPNRCPANVEGAAGCRNAT